MRFFLQTALLLGTSGVMAKAAEPARPEFLQKMESFSAQEAAQGIVGISEKLQFRATQDPFLIAATVIFLLAIVHTFLAVPIMKRAHKIQHAHDVAQKKVPEKHRSVSFRGTLLHFLGEVEAIFGMWVLVLLAAMTWFHGASSVTGYMMGVNFTEPLFVVIIMMLASTRPVLRFAEGCLRFFARFGKESPAAWWLSILVIAPVLGSFITEPAAMTIAAILLGRKFYRLKPRPLFAYGTLGLLFVNISVGGVMTNFAAPPVLMVAAKWELTTPHMFIHYGLKAVVGILLSTSVFYFFFRKDLASMAALVPDRDGDGVADWTQRDTPIPVFITVMHLLFMGLTVLTAHYPPLFIGAFLFFLAFGKATQHHQNPLAMKGPILVGFFLAGLVVHGGLQGWWLEPIISTLTEWPLFLGSALLTSFNDNAAITFLAGQVEGLSPALRYAVLAGAVTGGGLTVIANAPNPAGQALLSRYFGEGVSPLKLLTAALVPTIIVGMCFMLIPDKKVASPPAPSITQH